MPQLPPSSDVLTQLESLHIVPAWQAASAAIPHGSFSATTLTVTHWPFGREGLLKYILRPPLSTGLPPPGPDGVVRIALKKPFSDDTVAVDLDPLLVLCRLVALVPAPRFHTVGYSGGRPKENPRSHIGTWGLQHTQTEA